MLLYSKLLDDIQEKLPPEWRPLFQPLFDELHKRDILIWTAFFIACAGFTLSILNFINAFAEEQETYSTVLTSTGRQNAENRLLLEELLGEEHGTGTATTNTTLPSSR